MQSDFKEKIDKLSEIFGIKIQKQEFEIFQKVDSLQ